MKASLSILTALFTFAASAVTQVSVPTIVSKPYTGTRQTADVPDSPYYETVVNDGGTGAGTYEVWLELTDPVNTAWAGTDDSVVCVDFEITRADNAWTTLPSMTGWTYGETAKVPSLGQAKFGTIRYSYEGEANDGTRVSNASSVTKAGEYNAVFTVAGTANYTGLTNRVPFTVARAGIGGGGGGGGAAVNVQAYAGIYDGQEHSIAVTVTGDDAATFTVSYASAPTGPFLPTPPSFTAVTNATVWYCAASPFYDSSTNSATVSISPKTLSADNVWLVVPEEGYVYDGVAKIPLVACSDGTPSIITTNDFSVAFENAIGPGTGKAILMGRGNYTGICEKEYEIRSGRYQEVVDSFEPDGSVVYSNGTWHVTLTNSPAGPFVIPGDIGNVVLDLNGCNVAGTNGVAGSETVPGGCGGPAIRIAVPTLIDGGEPTQLTIKDSMPDDVGDIDIQGGCGGDGNPGGDGGAGILVDAGAVALGVKVKIGQAHIVVAGGMGGTGLNGGADGKDAPATDGVSEEDGSLEIDPSVEIRKAKVLSPVLVAKEYTGAHLSADVPSDARYTVRSNDGGTGVGTYRVWLKLVDGKRYCWADSDDELLDIPFVIEKATIDVSGVGWNYAAPIPYTAYEQSVELTNLPAGVTATYTGNRATDAGTYVAHATLNYNADNYVAMPIADLLWTIKPAVPIGGGNADPLGGSSINYSGVYDGESHGISVILRDPRPAGARVRYALASSGPFEEENPQFTDAGRTTVWYLVTADNYEPLTNSATVTISPKSLTQAQIRGKGLRENAEGSILPMLEFEDAWPCTLTTNDWFLANWTARAAGGGVATVQGTNHSAGTLTVEIGNEMTVLFDAVYGADVDSLRTRITETPGEPYILPPVPYYRGHEFLGWFTEREGGREVTTSTIAKLTDSSVFYAHWKTSSFSVAFSLGGGICSDCTEGMTVVWGQPYENLPIPTRDGYLFAGWYSSPDFQSKTKVEDGAPALNRDVTLYARWERRRLWYNDAVFHVEGAATWDGYLVDEKDVTKGTINVKVGKPNSKTGISKVKVKVTLGGVSKEMFSMTTYDGHFSATGKSGQKLDVQLYASGLVGSYGSYFIDGARNLFAAKDADSKVRAAQVLKRWQGNYALALGSSIGYGTFSIAVKAKGKTKVSGVLPDGTKVSVSTQLMAGERECALSVSYAKKGKGLSCLVWFCEDGTVECSNLDAVYQPVLIANTKSGAYLLSGARFRVDAVELENLVSGMRRDLSPDGLPVGMAGAKFAVAKPGTVKLSKDKSGIDETKLGENPSGLKLSYTIKTCQFKGAFQVYVLQGTKLSKVKATVSGVVVDGRGFGTATLKGKGSLPITITE